MTVDGSDAMPDAVPDPASWYRGHYHQHNCGECSCPRITQGPDANPVRDCCENHLCMCHWEGP
jgi:hypothetical protein